MVNKSELLEDLKGYLSFEEEVTQQLAQFYKALGWKKEVNIQDRETIEKGLIRLKEDSAKHASYISEMIKYVEETNKNEY